MGRKVIKLQISFIYLFHENFIWFIPIYSAGLIDKCVISKEQCLLIRRWHPQYTFTFLLTEKTYNNLMTKFFLISTANGNTYYDGWIVVKYVTPKFLALSSKLVLLFAGMTTMLLIYFSIVIFMALVYIFRKKWCKPRK